MQDFTFTLPTIGTAAMTGADQRDILLNQATAIIISEYLAHMNVAIQSGITPTHVPFYTQAELVSLINDVQTALRSI
jgi:hypothetical protein